MPESTTLLLFAAASLALLAIPGPSVLYVVARSLEHGRGAGLISVLGVETGALLHVAAAAGGLSAVLSSSPAAFTALKYAGVAYLLLLGVRALGSAAAAHDPTATPSAHSRARLFRDGVLIDVLNPKTALFFLGFLPQFVDPAQGDVALQALVLGLCFVVLAGLCDATYAVVAGRLGERMRRRPGARRRLDRATAGIYVGLALLAALSG